MTLIKIKNYSIKDNNGKFFVDNLSLDINEGDILGIAGNSGVGKTLLALSIVGITQSGIELSGEIKRNYSKNNKISILFQNPLNQIFSLKVYDEIKSALHLSNKDISKESIINIAKIWSIKNILNKRIDKLSLGEAQKVAIASIMISSPDLIILDEPFQYVDNSTFKDNLFNIKKNNPKIVVIIIEHNYYMLNQLCDRILYLSEGGHEVKDRVDCPEVEPLFFLSGRKGARHRLAKEASHRLAKEASHRLAKEASHRLALTNILFSYGKNNIFSGFSFELEKNFLIIDGKNGSGKSTLVKILVRLLKQKKGDVFYYFDDKTIKNPRLKNIRNKIGYIFQNPDYQIFANTVKDEIYYNLSRLPQGTNYVDYWLKKFHLSHLLEKSPHTLSYGERRRVNLLSATVNLPKIIIYDEPTVGLDYDNRKILLEFMEYHNKRGAIQILISHDRWFKEKIKGDITRITL